MANQNFVALAPRRVTAAIAAVALSLMSGAVAHAQDSPGTRAAGMGGAFVAVADDASAVYWNPAGLASGPLFNAQIDFGSADMMPGQPADPGANAARHSTRLIAVGVPPLGLSYYRVSQVHISVPSPAVVGSEDRQEGGLLARRLTTSHFGLTLLQSIGGGLAVGTTVKLVRGSLASGTVTGNSWNEVLDRGGDLEGEGRTRADLDAGVLLNAGQVRLGLVARNLREPDFAPDGVDDPDARLKRHVRLGGAWGYGWPGPPPMIVSVDADLTKTMDFDGERRDVATGVELWMLQRRLGVRAGWRASTVGESRPMTTGGLSVAVKRGVYVDAHIGRGDNERREWSVGGRFTY
jgi:hypothetical protein